MPDTASDFAIDTPELLNHYIKGHPNRACEHVIKMTSGQCIKCTDCPLEACIDGKKDPNYNWRDYVAISFKAGIEWALKNNCKSA